MLHRIILVVGALMFLSVYTNDLEIECTIKRANICHVWGVLIFN
jgi:hypothetical protein